MKTRKAPYSEEFKKEALHLLETSGKTKAELARDLGLSHGLLGKWQLGYQTQEETHKLIPSEVEHLKAEIRQLKRDNSNLSLLCQLVRSPPTENP